MAPRYLKPPSYLTEMLRRRGMHEGEDCLVWLAQVWCPLLDPQLRRLGTSSGSIVPVSISYSVTLALPLSHVLASGWASGLCTVPVPHSG